MHLFERIGIELEYMIVRRSDLAVLPAADRLMEAEAGAITSDVAFDDITWSNELVLHVIELKVTEPAASLEGLAAAFDRHVARINRLLAPMGGQLMPGAMHPLMNPTHEMVLWPHDAGPIYRTFDRIFDCRGHGWANLQSLHINLPFAGDEEFGRLHAGIRLILPILPAIAASSPILEGTVSDLLDTRLAVYRTNCARIPSIAGRVIPEPVFTPSEYQERILAGIYRDLDTLDPEGVIHEEWVNARGAIARFDRDTIEIRLIDVQECPAADLAVAAAVVGVLRLLASELWSSLASQQSWTVEPLAAILDECVRNGEQASISDAGYLQAFGWQGPPGCSAGELWKHLLEAVEKRSPGSLAFCARELDMICGEGTLARRILRAAGETPDREQVKTVYRRLCRCLDTASMFSSKVPPAS